MDATDLDVLPHGGAPLGDGLWLLDPGVAHLNHGSFGAVPGPVLAAQLAAARRIEASPERFYRADLAPAIDAVRGQVAEFLHIDPAGLALVQNATEAVQVALDAVDLQPGAEIVYTDHAYGWVQAAIHRACLVKRAVARRVTLPTDALPSGSATHGTEFAELLSERLVAAVTDRTSLVVIDQVTSASALLLPVDAVIRAVADATRGRVPVLVDGAHAPGLIDAPVPAGAAFWLGNLHKWAFAARTAAALVVAAPYRERVEPLVASAGAVAGFPRSFSYLGTQDPSAYLALPTSLTFPRQHLGMSFMELKERNRAVLARGMALLEERLGVTAAPDNGLPLRTVALGVDGDDAAAAALSTRLRDAGVEVAITSVSGGLHARVSVQAYVGLDDFDRLGAALASARGRGD